MQLPEFHKLLRGKNPEKLADEFLHRDTVTAFPTADCYNDFRQAVSNRFADAEYIAVAGTANWLYSLNPNKYFKPYDKASDIDTVVVSLRHFTQVWDALRSYDRGSGFRLPVNLREDLRRNGQNVYAGFISPIWIPDATNHFRYSHQRDLNALSDSKVGFRQVRMYFFRNMTEAIDYYSRGIRLARKSLQ